MKKREWIEEYNKECENYGKSIFSHDEDNVDDYDRGIMSHLSDDYDSMSEYESYIKHFQD